MRKFYLSDNEYGNSPWDISDPSSIFVSNPEGLGISFDNKYSYIGDGFYPIIYDKKNQNSIKFTLNFFGYNSQNVYAMYYRLMQFIFSKGNGGLYLLYDPGESREEFIRKIHVESIEKNEINKYGYLESSCSFKAVTPWYRKNTKDTLIDHNNLSIDRVSVSSPGQIPSALKFNIQGTAPSGMSIVLKNDDGIEYGRCKFLEAFSDCEIELSSQYNDSHILKIDSQGQVENYIHKIDISTNPFFRIPKDGNYVIQVTPSSAITSNLQIDFYKYDYYLTV